MIEVEHIEGTFEDWKRARRKKPVISDGQKAGFAKGGYIGPRTFFGVDPGGEGETAKGWSWQCGCKTHFVLYGSRAKCATCGMEAGAPDGF